jgi:hypothetical protein
VVELELGAVIEPHRGGPVRAGPVGAGVAGRRVGGGEALVDRLVDATILGDLAGDVGADVAPPGLLGGRQRDAVLRALRPGDRRHDGGQVELEVLGERRLVAGVEPKTLLLGVRLDQRDLLVGAPREPDVGDGLGVDGEDRAGGAELGTHVADGGPVGHRHGGDAVAVELHELADDAVPPQHLGDGEHEVGGGGAGGQLAGQLEADHPRDEHRYRLAEHRRLRLDAANAPAEHADAVFHGGVRIGADTGVGVGGAVTVEDNAREVFDVDLVHDAGAWRDDAEVVEALLPPLEELVALLVAAVLKLHVALEGVRTPEHIDDHRMVDDHFGRRQRVDLGRVAAQVADCLAHGGQVDDAGHAREVLHDHPRRGELDLLAGLRRGLPGRQRADVVGGDVGAVLGAQEVLEEHLEAVRETSRAVDGVQPIDLVRLVAHRQRAAAAKAVHGHHVVVFPSVCRPTYLCPLPLPLRCSPDPAVAGQASRTGEGSTSADFLSMSSYLQFISTSS